MVVMRGRARVGPRLKISGDRFLWRKSSSEMASRSIGIGGEVVCQIPFDMFVVSVVTDFVLQLMVKRKAKPPRLGISNLNH